MVDGIHRKASGMHLSRSRIGGWYFPREDSVEKYKECGRCALLLLLWRLSTLLGRSCWYVTDKYRRAIDLVASSQLAKF